MAGILSTSIVNNSTTTTFIFIVALVHAASAQDTLIATELLGRPTDRSITLNVVTGYAADGFMEYGRVQGHYTSTSDTISTTADAPLEIITDGLAPDTRYYYRLAYRRSGTTDYIRLDEHTFHTQRSRGSTYRFGMEADPHMYDKKGSHGMFVTTLRNAAADSFDFFLDLGDTFGNDHVPADITASEAMRLHLAMRPYLGIVCHSAPFFFCVASHEGESGYWLLQNPPDNMAVNSTLARLFYYPNPVPDSFYTGNTTAEAYGIGLPENYYAWEWGDALFVVLDAYRGYTASAKPRGWDWTLGKAQYDWFRQTLENSTAPYKFVIAHHVLGETRGGIAVAPFHEWGGREADGTTWGFDKNRPGWGKPVHQLMIDNNVQIFFQGHDHLFAFETLDGIAYQTVPMPSDSTYIIGTRDNGDAFRGDTIGASGHIRVTVAPDSALVEYVRAWLPADTAPGRVNGRIAYSYAVRPLKSEVRVRHVGLPGTEIATAFSVTAVFRGIDIILPTRQPVSIRMFDASGRLLLDRTLGPMDAGPHRIGIPADGMLRTACNQVIVHVTAGTCQRTIIVPIF